MLNNPLSLRGLVQEITKLQKVESFFGSKCYIAFEHTKSKACIFLATHSQVYTRDGYLCFDLIDNKVYTSKDARFLKQDFSLSQILVTGISEESQGSTRFHDYRIVPLKTSNDSSVTTPIDGNQPMTKISSPNWRASSEMVVNDNDWRSSLAISVRVSPKIQGLVPIF